MMIEKMIGVVFSEVKQEGDDLIFIAENGDIFMFSHYQNCCERVEIESIVGDLEDLVGNPLLIAEESTSDIDPSDAKHKTIKYYESYTWTFYKFATIKGHVDIRWYGSSNGYYSESVDIDFYPANKES